MGGKEDMDGECRAQHEPIMKVLGCSSVPLRE